MSLSKRTSMLFGKNNPIVSSAPTSSPLKESTGNIDDDGIQLKTEWKRKGDRVNFFTKEASNADFFDLVYYHYKDYIKFISF